MYYAIENENYNARHRTRLVLRGFATKSERDEFVSERKSERSAHMADFAPIARVRRSQAVRDALTMGMSYTLNG